MPPGTCRQELVNSLLRPCHHRDAKPELPLTSFLRQQRYRDYRLSSIHRIYYIAVSNPNRPQEACFAPFVREAAANAKLVARREILFKRAADYSSLSHDCSHFTVQRNHYHGYLFLFFFVFFWGHDFDFRVRRDFNHSSKRK